MKKYVLLFVIATSSICSAKIIDPPGVYFKGHQFCSHANTVFAVKTKNKKFNCSTDSTESKVARKIWETELPFSVEPEKYNVHLESDVQLCIVQGLYIEGSDVIASNCEGEKYRLNQKTGKLKKTSTPKL